MQNDKKGVTMSRTLVLFVILTEVKDLKATKHRRIKEHCRLFVYYYYVADPSLRSVRQIEKNQHLPTWIRNYIWPE